MKRLTYYMDMKEYTASFSEELRDVRVRFSKLGERFEDDHDVVILKGYQLFLSSYPNLVFFLTMVSDEIVTITESQTGMSLIGYASSSVKNLFKKDVQGLMRIVLCELERSSVTYDLSEKRVMAAVERNKKLVQKVVEKNRTNTLEVFF